MNVFERTMSEIDKRFDIDMKRSDAYVEMAVMEAAINIEEAEYKVMCESGDESDLDFMLEEAQEGFVAKVKAAIQKIIDAIVAFFKSVRDKIINFFTKKETDETIGKMEKKIKINPFFRNKKVEVRDTDQEVKFFDKYINQLKSFVAKIKSGNNVSDEEIDEAEKNFFRKHGAMIAGGTAVAAATGVALLKKRASKLESETNAAEKENVTVLESIKASVEKIGDSDAARKLQELGNKIAKAAQEKQKVVMEGVTGLMSKLKSLVSKGGNAEPDEEAIEESTFDEDDTFGEDDTYTESATDDLSAEFDALLGGLSE